MDNAKVYFTIYAMLIGLLVVLKVTTMQLDSMEEDITQLRAALDSIN